jgi:hypothetical protein
MVDGIGNVKTHSTIQFSEVDLMYEIVDRLYSLYSNNAIYIGYLLVRYSWCLIALHYMTPTAEWAFQL